MLQESQSFQGTPSMLACTGKNQELLNKVTTVNRMHVTEQLTTTEEAKIIEDGLSDIDSGCLEECGTASVGTNKSLPRM